MDPLHLSAEQLFTIMGLLHEEEASGIVICEEWPEPPNAFIEVKFGCEGESEANHYRISPDGDFNLIEAPKV
jgi:hypothetical protein